MQVLHRSGTPQEEGLLGDSVGDAQLAVLAWVVLQVERWVARFAPPLKQFAVPCVSTIPFGLGLLDVSPI